MLIMWSSERYELRQDWRNDTFTNVGRYNLKITINFACGYNQQL